VHSEMHSAQDGYPQVVRLFFSRLAVYFGLKDDDSAPAPGAPAPRRNIPAMIFGGILGGAIYALITAAVDGFDASVTSVVLRGVFFGVAMTVVGLVIQRVREDHAAK
jgi:hypothetical protein